MNADGGKKDSLSDRLRRKTIPPSAAPATNAGAATNSQATEFSQVLDGDLSEKPMSWLLMAAQHYEVTGRLQVGLAACPVIVQFGLGRAVHAQSPFSAGTEAILDLFIWQDGKVRFESGRQPESVTIQESTEDLIRLGEAYRNNLSFLEHHAINELSFLVRSPDRLTSAEVEKRLTKGQPIEINLQMDFYSNTYGTRNIKDTAEKLDLPSSQWVSIATNLLQLGILCTPEGRNIQLKELIEPAAAKNTADYEALRLPQVEAAPKPIAASLWQSKFVAAPVESSTADQMPTPMNAAVDMAMPASQGNNADVIRTGIPDQLVSLNLADLDAVLLQLNDSSTGILRSDVLQYFLVREFARAHRFKTILSLVLFCVKFAHQGSENQSVPLEVRNLLTGSVSRIKRDVDVFGHFGTQAYALLLPNVDSNQSCFLIDRINSDLPQLHPELAYYRPSLHFGVASVPQDATEVNGLVQAAQMAMLHAADNNLLRKQHSA